jgi:hypothetical protein
MSHALPEPDDDPTTLPEPEDDPLPEPDDEPEALPEPDETPAAAVAVIVNEQPENALVRVGADVLERASKITVTDNKSYAAAIQLGIELDGFIRDVHEFWDPRVELAHKPWAQACADRKALLDPLEKEKKRLVGTGGEAPSFRQREADRAAAEQRRLQAEADERAAAERRRLAEVAAEARREAERLAAAGRAEEAAQAVQDAREAVAQSQEVESAVISVKSDVPEVEGTTNRDSAWTFTVTDVDAFALAIFRPLILKEIVTDLKEKQLDSTEDGKLVIAYLDSLEGKCSEALSPRMLLVNEPALKLRVKADSDALKWPGLRIYKAASTAITPQRKRR